MGTGTQATTSVTGYFFYGAFGEVLKQNSIDAVYGDTAHRRQFNGKENDTVSQWRYYGARYYDPLMMRWTGADPLYRFAPEVGLEDPARQNLYAFSLNNPITLLDPDGENPLVAAAGVVGGGLATAGEVVGGAVLGAASATVATVGIFGVAMVGGGMAATEAGYEYKFDGHARPGKWVKRQPPPASPVAAGGRILSSGVKAAGNAAGNSVKGARALGAKSGGAAGAPGGSKQQPPNPNGKKGGPAHQEKVKDVTADIKSRGLKPVPERKVDTPGGNKGTRYVDVAAADENGIVVEMHQVGKQTQAGNPVAREVRAMDDIEGATGVRPVFHPYNGTNSTAQ